jgi:hypothetical protein
MFIPDVLRITVGAGGTSGINGTASLVTYQAKNGAGYNLLQANGGASGSANNAGGDGGIADSNNYYFGASGIFTSIAGQTGASGGSTGGGLNANPSATTFLSCGSGGSGASGSQGGSVTPNYGYPVLPTQVGPGFPGYFITQPIIVGCGGSGGGFNRVGDRGGIGCGGGGSGEDALSGGRGGDGAVFIWAW